MDQNTDIISLQRQTVFGFRTLDDAALLSLATKQRLPIAPTDLFLCRDHYRRVEWRDPTVGELLFLGALFRRCRMLPQNTHIDAIVTDDPEDQRAFADLQKKAIALAGEKAPLSVPQIMDTVGEALKRLGIHPWHETLLCDTVAGLATASKCIPPLLQLNGIAATLHTAKKKSSKTAQTLVLFRGPANGLESFLADIAQTEHRYIATVGAEGILPHLAALEGGVDLDLATIPEYDPQTGFEPLPQIGQNGILLALPYQHMFYLFARGYSLTVCGNLTADHRLTVRRGPEVCFSIATSLLQASGGRVLTPVLTRSEPTTLACEITAVGGTLLGGVQASGSCRTALCRLVADMATKGADLRRASATALLELPLENSDAAIGNALPLLLDLHRVAAELAIPVCRSRQLSTPATAVPRLSVFLAAEKTALPIETEAVALRDAAEKTDFAALRALLRK